MKRWFKYVKPYLSSFLLGPFGMIIEVIGEMFMPFLLAQIINSGEAGTLSVGKSIGISAILIGIVLFMMAGGVCGAYFGSKASVNFAADLRKDIYVNVQKFSFANIDRFSTGSLVTRMTNDVTQIQNFVNMLLRMALRAPGMLIGGIIMAIVLKPTLSVVLAVSIPLMLFIIVALIRIGFPRFGILQKKIDKLNSTVRENVTNVRVVKSFVKEDYEIEKFKEDNADLKNSGMRAVKVMMYMGPVMNLFMHASVIAIIWFGHKIVIDEQTLVGGMRVGDLSAFITYTTQILSSLMMVTMLFMTSSRALASGKRICEVLDEKLDLSDEQASNKDKKVEIGEVEFKNVNFRYYKNSNDLVLENINLKIKGGSTVGIIGSTGCGKTTLVSMISRLYDVDEGEVLVDGTNVKDYSLVNLRDGVGIVLQQNLLFSGTIEENLRWGSEEASFEEIKKYSEYAAADKFISSFKDGYDTVIDKAGTNLSGGQKQRVCIARALLKNPKILILDDSTSAVDTATERQIKYALLNSLPKCTKIIIAQRISSVRDAEQIIVMNDGKITGIGTHDELLENNPEYSEIYYSQIDKQEA
ncbi:MAG: ABC transporter ATP-binding protein [Ruminococcaceae bacterium]|nr:ABC transporter ATP-binding protein [Oscillospiraceae bacterium]